MQPDILVFDHPIPLGKRLRLLRTARELTQYDVAFAAGVAPSDVSQIERGLRVYPMARARILDFFGITEQEAADLEEAAIA